MPPRLEILQRLHELPVLPWFSDEIVLDDYVWKGRENGVNFELRKRPGSVEPDEITPPGVYLTLTGRRKNREVLKRDFTFALGKSTGDIKSGMRKELVVWLSPSFTES